MKDKPKWAPIHRARPRPTTGKTVHFSGMWDAGKNEGKVYLDGRKRRAYATLERNQQMLMLRRKGLTLQAIADAYGVSRERVRQITDKLGSLESNQD